METILRLNYSKEDLDKISRLVRENESFVALVTGDLYAPTEYLLTSDLSRFTAMLDRNVYTRITALVRGENVPSHALDDHRWAAAVLAFCQIADITFHYESSLQEYASIKGGEAALADFECFHLADNCDPQAWIDFATGRSDSLDLSSVANIQPPESPPTAEELERPTYPFRVNYIFALKIALLDRETEIPPEQRMLKFIDWMETDFILGANALQFANLLFSPERMKGMLKKGSLRAAANVAWDLALIQVWKARALECHAKEEPLVLATRDKVVKYIADRLIASDDDEFRGFIVEPWDSVPAKGEAIFERYMKLHEELESQEKRPFPSDERLDALTDQLEQQLLATDS